MKLIEDKVVLVTGASRGIGKAIVDTFVKEGAFVFAGVRDVNTVDVDQYGEYKDKVFPIQLDVCDLNSIKKAIVLIKKEYGKIDVLVNNAGITIIERFDMMRKESLHKIYDVNVFGLIDVTQMAIRLLKKSGDASIINVSSIMAEDSDIGQSAYASSKAAVSSLTKTWAKEYVENNIRVNAIAPGNVNTEMFNIIDGEDLDNAIQKIGMKRVSTPVEIANVALFLASNMSSYVTGEIISITGGLIL